MPTKVLIPSPLRGYTDKRDAIVLEGENVNEVLQQLTKKYPPLKKHLYTEDGQLRTFVNIYVNNEDIRYLQKEQTRISETDVVSIIPSIAGGRKVTNDKT